MGDGLPSLAPQWLKSGSSSALGAGTHHGHSSTASSSHTAAKAEEASRSWRESGSRLGWGAGAADREADAKQGSRRQSSTSGYQDRSRSFSSERASYRPSNGRLLSDRELVEQTGSLKLRPGGSRSPEASKAPKAFGADPFPAAKNGFGSRGTGARSGGAGRKPGGSGSRALSLPQTPERDFPGLSSRAAAPASAAPWLAPGGLSPRSASSEQPWTSRLADVPAAAAEQPPVAAAAAPAAARVEAAASSSQPAAAEPAPAAHKAAPRMADAILQAQASAAAEAEAARVARLRMEQLQLRQSKQLVPVLAGAKPKPAPVAVPGPAAAPSLMPLKKPLGMEPLGRMPQPAAVRREPPAKAAAAAAGEPPSRERDRLAFFGSLRRKASGGPELTGANGGDAAAGRAGSAASEGAASPSPSPEGRPEAPANGRREPAAGELLPEEVAFMRSLGWTEADAEDGGLTEEEVAAFLARYPTGSAKPNGTSLQQQQQQQQQQPQPQPARSSSLRSELEFSDSDAE